MNLFAKILLVSYKKNIDLNKIYIMIIDAHGHACCNYNSIEQIQIELNKNSIDKVVLFPADVYKDRIDNIKDYKNTEILYFSNVIGKYLSKLMNLSKKINFGNNYVYCLKQLLPDRIIQFYQPTPKYIDKLDEDYKKMHFSGIKLHQCVNYFSIKSNFFSEVLDFAERNDLPILIHLCGKQDAINIIEVIKYRKVKLIIAHLLYNKLFAERWDEINTKIYFDLANYYFIKPRTVDFAIKTFGYNKLIFGSDNPFGIDTIEKTIKMIEDLSITNEEKKDILGGNIRNLLGI